jgi:large subunit ribosomal protein L23
MGILNKITKKEAGEEKKDEAKKSAKPKAAEKKAAKPAAASKKPAAKSAAKADDKKAEAKKDDKKAKGTAKKAGASLFAYQIILEPVLTEKGDRGQMVGKYTFYVSRDANKVEIARAIKELYGVKPVSVRVLNQKGKAVRFGRLQGTRKNRKKAVVTLKQGDTISVTE